MNLRDSYDALTSRGLWKFLAKYPTTSAGELVRAFYTRAWVRLAQRLIPSVQRAHLSRGFAGIRAQVLRAYHLVILPVGSYIYGHTHWQNLVYSNQHIF